VYWPKTFLLVNSSILYILVDISTPAGKEAGFPHVSHLARSDWA